MLEFKLREPETAMGFMGRTTRAAEGLPRRAFSVREVERMQRLGVIRPDERFELVEGEIVPMQAKSPTHELIKETLTRLLIRALPDDVWLGVERTIFLSPMTALDPDVTLFRAVDKASRVDGPRLLLCIEVSHSSLSYDRGKKAELYARYGVPEYWMVDVRRRRTIIHEGPQPDGTWAQRRIVGPDEALSHPAAPGFALKLADV